jgi:ABC-type multidrug transport system fused ATPase/permease subunit
MNEETHSLSHLSRIVIIDEATAAVDAFSEGMLQSVLKNFFGLNVNKESNGPSRARRRSSEESEGDKATDTVEAEMCRRTTVLMICHKVDGIRSLCDYELKMTDGELEYYRDVHNTI